MLGLAQAKAHRLPLRQFRMLAPATAPCYPPLASHAATPKATKRLSPPIWPSFFALADVWKLSIDRQIVLLGSPARST